MRFRSYVAAPSGKDAVSNELPYLLPLMPQLERTLTALPARTYARIKTGAQAG